MALSQEEVQLLEKFGFRIHGESAVHKKMGIEKDLAAFRGLPTLGDLEEYVKKILRNT